MRARRGDRHQAARSLGANALANYASQAFVAAIGLVMAPVFLSRMGVEAYGLIGFFTLLNAWFQILDAGLSLTLARESARFRGGAIDSQALNALFAVLERFFLGGAVVGAAIIAVVSRWIASAWLRTDHLSLPEVTLAVLLMGLTVPMQWATGVYRGALNGFERQVWLAGFNSTMAALRFGGAGLAIYLAAPTPRTFFTYQFVVSALELAVLISAGRRALPPWSGERRALDRAEVRGLLGFSGSLAFSVLTWVLVTQVDKLILSRILTLARYGVFSLAAVAASGVLMLSQPLAQALLPRLAKVAAEGDEDELRRLYRWATQIVCLVTAPAVFVLAALSNLVVFVWTGDRQISAAAAPIVTLYALGNGLQAVGSFPYYLQYARGNLRLHVIANLLLAVVLVPAILVCASRWGALGAGSVWLALNAIYVMIWVPFVHHRLAPGLNRNWFLIDIAPILIAAGVAAIAVSRLMPVQGDRLFGMGALAASGCVVFLCAAAASSVARDWVATVAVRCTVIIGGRRQ